MVDLTVDQIRALMGKASNIRHVSVIGQAEEGKTTLINSLSKARIVSAVAPPQRPTNTEEPESESRVCFTADTEQEATKSITIKSTTSSLYFEMTEEDFKVISEKSEGTSFLINMIDCPGNVDFSSEVTTALRVTDGALVVVDCRTGVCSRTETLLCQALNELVKPVLVINKVDRALLELSITKEELYQSFARVINSVNATITTFNTEKSLGDFRLYPVKGSVAFGSCLHGWAFTIRHFARRYSIKFGVDQDKIAKKLWGDHFFIPATKLWSRKSHDEDGKPRERAFNMFILDPILKIFDTIMNRKKEDTSVLLGKLDIKLTPEEDELEGKALFKLVMARFLPASEALMGMVVLHLPSPVAAQKYKIGTIYEGPQNDECADGIRTCDPNGPLMLYISRMMLSTDKDGRFYAFGRIFSGIVRAGLKVRIQGPAYEPGRKSDLFIKPIQRIVIMLGQNVVPVPDCSAGNIVGLVGIDQFLLKTGTITTSDGAHNFRTLKFSLVPVVQVTVDAKDPADLPKLIKGLKRLSVADPSFHSFVDEAGGHVIAGSSEQHLELCLRDLQNDYAPQVPIRRTEMVSLYRETCKATSTVTALAKSPNRHSRVFMKATPLDENLTLAIEKGVIRPRDDFKLRARVLSEDYGWEHQEARKIWAFGPDSTGPNVLVDMTKAVAYLNEIKDSAVAGFNWATREGPYTDEMVRGVRYNILDVYLGGNAIHRGGGQIIPAFRSAIYASHLLAEPGLMEPMYAVEITCPELTMGGIYGVLNRRRGYLVDEKPLTSGITTSLSSSSPSSPGIYLVKAYLPVQESFGFTSDLCQATQGQAVAQLVFDHWKTMPGNCVDDILLQNLILKIRKRKGLREIIPTVDIYLDRL